MNRPKPPVTAALLSRRTEALKRHLPAAVDGDGIGVHQARVASRRLREAVPVVAADLKGGKAGKARRKIRRLTRALGAVRELDVTLLVLDELAATDTLPRVALEEVRRHVVEERERRRKTMLERLDTVNVPKLERRLVSVAEALEEHPNDAWRKTLAGRLMKRAKALGGAIGEAGQLYSPEGLHRVRIATKKLRYGLEIAAEAGIRPAAGLVRQLKRTQDDLGRLHDLQVLLDHVAAVQTKPSDRRVTDSSLGVVARALEDQTRHLHGSYVATAPKLLAIVEATRRQIVPLLARGGGVLKMTAGASRTGRATAKTAAGRRA